jgi:hypothetical protein
VKQSYCCLFGGAVQNRTLRDEEEPQVTSSRISHTTAATVMPIARNAKGRMLIRCRLRNSPLYKNILPQHVSVFVLKVAQQWIQDNKTVTLRSAVLEISSRVSNICIALNKQHCKWRPVRCNELINNLFMYVKFLHYSFSPFGMFIHCYEMFV